ncbi:JmjC domain-containing protein [Mycena kentingensis (nom. inval.)]|nr:JmjC domain-containing protein [Mycena kentingensis (nom. inval.)]
MESRRRALLQNQRPWGASVSSSSGSASPPVTGVTYPALDSDVLDQLVMRDSEARYWRRPTPPPTDAPFSCKDWTLKSLIARSSNFHPIPRIPYSSNVNNWTKAIAGFDNGKGIPFIVEGLHKQPKWLKTEFAPEWMVEHSGIEEISARNVHTRTDRELSLKEFLAKTRQMSPHATVGETERLYGKDMPCPDVYREFLNDANVVPRSLAPDGDNNLLQRLPKADQPETLMCYWGVGDTFTPAHKDLCASHGHNLMTYTEENGCSYWFMTATASANEVSEYFHHSLTEDLDHETHVVTIEQLAKAPFEVYIAQQTLGDLVIVPPRSAHQVVNAGGLTIKTSWSRMTVEGLTLALRFELPLYRRVCRVETYRVKSTIYHTLVDATKRAKENNIKHKGELSSNLRKLIRLYDAILEDEYAETSEDIPNLPERGFDEIGQLVCDFCGADIFQSFFECGGDDKPEARGTGFKICSGCYVEGRACKCTTMVPVQCRPFKSLTSARTLAIRALKGLNVSTSVPAPPKLSHLLPPRLRGIFQAALLLHRRRSEKVDQRRCTVQRQKELSHDVLNAIHLRCKKCHNGMCFAHLVHERSIHSIEALHAYEEDATHAVYHNAHLDSRGRYHDAVAALQRQDLEHIPDPRVQLAYLARTYTTCRPVNPNSKLWQAGFYDLNVWETDPTPTSPAMPLTPSTVFVSPHSKKRLIMDCVLVPHVPPRLPRAKPHTASAKSRAVEQTPSKPLKSTKPTPSMPAKLRKLDPKPKRRKEAISIDSDSDDEPLAKRPRTASKSASKSMLSSFSFPKTATADGGMAASLAAAYNSAGAQNAAGLDTPRERVASSSQLRPLKRKASQPALPRRQPPSPAATSTAPASTSSSSSDDIGPHTISERPYRDLSFRDKRPIASSSKLPAGEVKRPSVSTSKREMATNDDTPSGIQNQINDLKDIVATLVKNTAADTSREQLQQQLVVAREQQAETWKMMNTMVTNFPAIVQTMAQGFVPAQLPPPSGWNPMPPSRHGYAEWQLAPQYGDDGYRRASTPGYNPSSRQYPRPSFPRSRMNARHRSTGLDHRDIHYERRTWPPQAEEEHNQPEASTSGERRRNSRFSSPNPAPRGDDPAQRKEETDGGATTAVENPKTPIELPKRKKYSLALPARYPSPTQDWEDTYAREEPE